MAILGDEEKSWLDYITKLNDRYFSRQKTSGFTSYAILGLIGVLLFNLIDQVSSNLPFSSQIHTFWVSLNNSFNLGISIIIILANLSMACEPIQSPRLSTRTSIYPSFILSFLLSTIIISCIALNINTIFYIPDFNLNKMPYMLFSLFLGFILSTVILQKTILVRKKIKLAKKFKSKGIDFPKLSPMPITAFPFANIIFTLMITTSLFLVFSSIFSWFDFVIKSDVLQKPHIIKISIELFALVVLVALFVQKYVVTQQNIFLENLERKIIVENITSDEIKKIFVREFLGETTRDWINDMQNKMDKKYDVVISEIEKSKKSIEDIKVIDDKYQYEISGRKEKSCENALIPYRAYVDYTKGKMAQMRYLIDQKAFIFTENELIIQLIELWEKQNKSIDKSYDEFCKLCKETSCSSKQDNTEPTH